MTKLWCCLLGDDTGSAWTYHVRQDKKPTLVQLVRALKDDDGEGTVTRAGLGIDCTQELENVPMTDDEIAVLDPDMDLCWPRYEIDEVKV